MINKCPHQCDSVASTASELGIKRHNTGFDAQDLDYTYIAIEVNDIEDVSDLVATLGFDGLPAADPFNKRMPGHLDKVPEDVERIVSCNRVVIEDGEITGYNGENL